MTAPKGPRPADNVAVCVFPVEDKCREIARASYGELWQALVGDTDNASDYEDDVRYATELAAGTSIRRSDPLHRNRR